MRLGPCLGPFSGPSPGPLGKVRQMANVAVIGAQWGDEGKGKIVDLLAERFEIVARYQGGNNAGHTVVSKGQTWKLSLIPSGILRDDVTCVVTGGVALDPDSRERYAELLTIHNRAVREHCLANQISYTLATLGADQSPESVALETITRMGLFV